jgi:hypothetical protein
MWELLQCIRPLMALGRYCPIQVRSMLKIARAIVFIGATIFFYGALHAEEASKGVRDLPAMPERIRDLFDLAWCARWRFQCESCERTQHGIECSDYREACQESFAFYKCEKHNLPKGCLIWRDGCNSCGIKSGDEVCTLKPCDEYRAPNKPTFECLRYGNGADK